MNSHSSGFAENIFVLINHVLCNLSYSIFFNIHSSYWSKQVVIHEMINFQSPILHNFEWTRFISSASGVRQHLCIRFSCLSTYLLINGYPFFMQKS